LRVKTSHPGSGPRFGPESLFQEAIRRFDEENSRDPNLESVLNPKDTSMPPNPNLRNFPATQNEPGNIFGSLLTYRPVLLLSPLF